MKRNVLVALLLALFHVVTAAPALAHATLVESEPASGATLAEAPETIVLTFNEPTSLLSATLVDGQGTRVELDPDQAVPSGTAIIITVPAGIGEGTSVLSWRAASGDGHPISGTVLFSVGAASSVAASPEAADPLVKPLLWLTRAAMFLCLLLGAGSSSFRMVAPALPAGARQATLVLLPLGIAAVAGSIPLQGLDALGRPLQDIAAPDVWRAALSTGYGASAVAALCALVLASIAVATGRERLAGAVAVLSFIAIGLTASLGGHASSAAPQWLTRPMVFVHVACIAWWAGELLPLALVLKGDRAVGIPPLMRFSRIIPFVIAPLVISGVTLAAIQLGPPGPTWFTPYGYILAAKLALLVVLFLVASFNRWGLTAQVVAGGEIATRRMRRAILVEIALIVLVVGLAAGWRFTPPPRSLAALGTSEVSVALSDAKGRVAVLDIVPGRAGANAATVAIESPAGEPIAARSVTVTVANGAQGIGPIETAAEGGANAWRIEPLVFPAGGEWTVAVEVRISDFELTRFEGTATIAP